MSDDHRESRRRGESVHCAKAQLRTDRSLAVSMVVVVAGLLVWTGWQATRPELPGRRRRSA